MRNVLKLARSAPPSNDDPLRAALAEAIARHTEAKVEHDRLASALETARTRAWELTNEVARQAEQVREMEASSASRLASALMAGDSVADADLKGARQRLDELREQQQAVESARQSLMQSLEPAAQGLKWRESALETRAGEVLASISDAIADQVTERLSEVYALGNALSVISRHHRPHPPTASARRCEGIAYNLQHVRSLAGLSAAASEDLATRLSEAFAALKIDANASLPEV